MAGPHFLITFICIIIIPTISSYNVLNRVFNKIDNQRLLIKNPNNSTSMSKVCIPVEAVKQLDCSIIDKNTEYYDLFESVCRQHRLCYACGYAQGISKGRCDKLTRIHMYDLCSKNSLTTSDCLLKRYSILHRYRQDDYRAEKFSSECSDKCILKYLFDSE